MHFFVFFVIREYIFGDFSHQKLVFMHKPTSDFFGLKWPQDLRMPRIQFNLLVSSYLSFIIILFSSFFLFTACFFFITWNLFWINLLSPQHFVLQYLSDNVPETISAVSNLWHWQIHLEIWTDLFCNLNKYISDLSVVNLEKYI